MSFVISFLLSLVSLPLIEGWWADGHMLVSQIAYSILSPTARVSIDPLISSLASSYPDSPEFVSAAAWADDLKTMGVNQYNNWHYIDLPIVGSPVFFEVPGVGNTSVNPWAIDLGITTISTPSATPLDQAIQLRFIIHFVGDIHQPLHAATFFSSQFATGDAGGNLWNVTVPYANISNLHSLWDSGIGFWSDDIVRPLNATGEQWLSTTANTIMELYPASSFTEELLVTDPFQWAVESNILASTFVYTAPQSPTPISQAYLDAAYPIAESQVALAGYRLAQALESVYNPDSAHFGVYAAGAKSRSAEALAKLGGAAKKRNLRTGGRN